MVRGYFAGDGQAFVFGGGDKLDFVLAANVAKVERTLVDGGHSNADSDALAFGVHGDGFFPRPFGKAALKVGEFVYPERAEGVIKVDFEGDGVESAGGETVKVDGTGSSKEAELATGG
jgi:hypothetical protein